MKVYSIFFYLAITAMCACDQGLKGRDTTPQDKIPTKVGKAESQRSDGEGAQQPERISGTYLTCAPTDNQIARNQEKISCRLNQDDIKVQLGDAEQPNWSVSGLDSQTNVAIQENTGSSPWHVTYTYSSNQPLDNTKVMASTVKLTYTDKKSQQRVSLSAIVQTILQGLEDVKHVRVYFDSIKRDKDNPGSDTMYKAELKINGTWHTAFFNFLTTNMTIEIGPHLANLQASDNDLLMLKSVFGLGSFDFSIPNSYETYGSYDLKPEAEVYLEISFEQPSSIQGIRFNNGQPISSKDYVDGIPDQYHIETSQDRTKWKYLAGSDVTLSVATSIVDLEWSK